MSVCIKIQFFLHFIVDRYWKPFNPLLGETFEFIDKAQGYAVVCEQVSHHPPVSALHAESDKWMFWEEYQLDTRFRGLVRPHLLR